MLFFILIFFLLTKNHKSLFIIVNMPVINNITRLLDSKKIKYKSFETPAEKLGALETARLINTSPEYVYKSIVIVRQKPGKHILAVISGTSQVDLKLVANEVNEKKVLLPTEKEAERITGLLAGGISPLALINKGFQIIIDESAKNLPEMHVSGGQRGLNISLSPLDLQKITNAKFAKVSTPLDSKID